MIRSLFISFCAVALLLTGGAHAFAQSVGTINLDFSIVPSPQNPTPHQTVTLTAQSYSFDVNVAMITWYVGGKKVSSGLGQKTLTLPVGDVGQTLQVSVDVRLTDGTDVTGTIALAPQSVTIINEAIESYVPPFYEGLALPAPGANVKVVAVPFVSDGRGRVPESNLSFNWYVNDDFQTSASGIGKSSALLQLDTLQETTSVRVLVRSPGGKVAEKTIDIAPHEVMPLLYSYDDLLGTHFNNLLTRRLETTQPITLDLEPMYLSTKGLESSTDITWTLDGLPVTPIEKTLLTLKPAENAYGDRMLSVAIEQGRRYMQKANTSIEILFDTRQ